ncbi:MAG: nucleotide exchange factor GrpE [Pyrinomonadaceae bacterium]
MEPLENTNGDVYEIDESPDNSVDEFIRQLEEREKDLDISSDLVIEVGESEVEHDNIHDSFVAPIEKVEKKKETEPGAKQAAEPPMLHSDRLKLEHLESERNDLRESLRRQQRDFDNYRQRTERERHETYKNVLANLAGQMLPVLDNLNRALDAAGDIDSQSEAPEIKVFFEGIVLVNQQLNEVLAGMGVQPIISVGAPFDPNVHEAVASEESDEHPPQTVIFELLRGYRLDDRVIRASMVKVSAASKRQDSQPADAE